MRLSSLEAWAVTKQAGKLKALNGFKYIKSLWCYFTIHVDCHTSRWGISEAPHNRPSKFFLPAVLIAGKSIVIRTMIKFQEVK